MSRLPDYTGSLEVSGSVTVDDGEDPGSLALGFEIHGAEADGDSFQGSATHMSRPRHIKGPKPKAEHPQNASFGGDTQCT